LWAVCVGGAFGGHEKLRVPGQGAWMAANLHKIFACAALAVAIMPVKAAEPCSDIERARQATYLQYAKLVVDDVNTARKNTSNVPFNTAIQQLGASYVRTARFGDTVALRKLIGLGLFTALAANAQPLDTTFKLVCELAQRAPQPLLTLDPLTCAVIAVDGARRDDQENRALARYMVDLARVRMASDPNGPAAHTLFDGILPIITRCGAQ
jgi:hypothetical protein